VLAFLISSAEAKVLPLPALWKLDRLENFSNIRISLNRSQNAVDLGTSSRAVGST
jgi:hypothetical protein